MKQAAAKPTTTKGSLDEVQATHTYAVALFDIGWRMLVIVLVSLIGGKWLDNRLNTRPLFVLLGLVLIVLSFALVLWQFLKKLPKSQGGLKHG